MAKFIYGRNAVTSALKTGEVQKLYLTPEIKGFQYQDLLKGQSIEVISLSRKQLDDLVKTDKHQGVVALINEFKFAQLSDIFRLEKEFPLVVILDEVSDPQNYGAIIRSCDEFGVDFIIVKDRNQSPVNNIVAKASAGATSYVKIIEVTNLNQTIQILKDNKFWVLGMAGEAANDIYHFDYKIPVALVFGSEGSGIAALTKKNCDALLKIPTVGHVGSLNVSVSVGITLAVIKHAQNP